MIFNRVISRIRASLVFRARRFLYTYIVWPAPVWIIRGHASFKIGGHHLKMDGPVRENLQRMRRGVYEAGLGEVMSELVRTGDVFFDIGAHIGVYSLLASATVGDAGKVIAFEPDPVALAYLRRNVNLNNAGNITVVESAVSDSDGMAQLTASKFGLSGTTLGHKTGNGATDNIVASTVRLDSFCESRDLVPDVIKIDVEGGDGNVLKSGFEILKNARVVFFEFHPVKIRSDFDTDPEEVFSQLRRMGKRLLVVGDGAGDSLMRDVRRDERFAATTRLILTNG